MEYIKTNKIVIMLALVVLLSQQGFVQEPIRVGTTSGEFLGVSYGAAATAMGDAYVAVVNDVTGIYWNPAGLSFMQQSEAMFTYQPWIADITTLFAGCGIVVPGIGTIAMGAVGADYGQMDVTTVEDQDGTGEKFSVHDYAFSLSYARKLAQWFGFGASAKYISSVIWHETASAYAFDLGVLINTPFFSSKGEGSGLNIGMSLSNYGAPMKYDGLDLLRSHDILPDQAGNYQDTKVKFETDRWELPLIFRIGMSLTPMNTDNHKIIVAVDALHVNNNSETVNLGLQYTLYLPGFGKFYLRGGYRALFLKNSEFGPTFGAGISKQYMGNKNVLIDFSYRDIGVLGIVPSFGASFTF